jgi:hypothetical protein
MEQHTTCIAACDAVVAALEQMKATVNDGDHPDSAGWRKLLVKALSRRSAAHAISGEACSATTSMAV